MTPNKDELDELLRKVRYVPISFNDIELLDDAKAQLNAHYLAEALRIIGEDYVFERPKEQYLRQTVKPLKEI